EGLLRPPRRHRDPVVRLRGDPRRQRFCHPVGRRARDTGGREAVPGDVWLAQQLRPEESQRLPKPALRSPARPAAPLVTARTVPGGTAEPLDPPARGPGRDPAARRTGALAGTRFPPLWAPGTR